MKALVTPTAEHQRLAAANADKANWRLWGPYLSERQWGTVREDYSATGEAWEYLPHDLASASASECKCQFSLECKCQFSLFQLSAILSPAANSAHIWLNCEYSASVSSHFFNSLLFFRLRQIRRTFGSIANTVCQILRRCQTVAKVRHLHGCETKIEMRLARRDRGFPFFKSRAKQ
jgi:hypothetical protein